MTEITTKRTKQSHETRSTALFLLGVGVGVTAAVAAPTALAYLFLHPPRHLFASNPRSVFGYAYERFRVKTEDGIPLSGWYVPASSEAETRGVVVLCHGYTGNRATMLTYLPFLHEAGYAAVFFDFRAHGWSGGRMSTFGHHEPLDLDTVLNWIEIRSDLSNLPLALLGESMGASVALIAAADEARVSAVVADSPFARFDTAVEGRLLLSFGPILAPIILPSTLRSGERMLGVRCDEIAPEVAIKRLAPRPVLLIHGLGDRLLIPENSRRINAAAPGNVEFWEVEGSNHARAVHDVTEEYGRRVVAFLDANLTA